MSNGLEQRKLAAIMFTDMVGYSALSQRNEALALELLEEHRGLLRQIVPRHGGREVKTMGDGFLFEFPSALSAVQGAVEIQQSLHDRNQAGPPERQIRVRIGIHVGDVVQREGDIHGDGVNIAARLEPLAAPGGICVSEDVARPVRNKLSLPLAVLRHTELKHIDLPVAVFRVVMPWEQGAAHAPAPSAWLAVGTLLLAVLIVAFWQPLRKSGTPTVPATDAAPAPPSAAAPLPAPEHAAPEKSVAVLAFANLSDDKQNEYFSDGISEELLNVLAKIPGLKVSARTSAFFFKGKQVPISEIAKQLGVAYVVEGSVRKAGERLRITAQLINVADGFHVWSDTFDRDAKDVFAVQDEIAGLVARKLSMKLDVAPGAVRTVNPEAHGLLLEGRHFLAQRDEVGFARAEKALKRAVELDPTFAPAHAALAELFAVQVGFQSLGAGGRRAADSARAFAQAELAMQMDPSLAEPHAVLGLLLTLERRMAEAEPQFQQAFRLNPNYAIAHHWRANLLIAQGRLEEGLVEIEQALRLNPLSFITAYAYASYLNCAGKLNESLAVLDRASTLRSDLYLPGLSERAVVLLRLSRNDEAVAVARAVLQAPATSLQSWSGGDAVYVLRQAGLTDEAERNGGAMLATLPADSYLRGYVLCALGRFDEGVPLLESSSTIVLSRLFLLPLLDPARDTPRFKELLVKLDCVEEYRRARESLARIQKEGKR